MLCFFAVACGSKPEPSPTPKPQPNPAAEPIIPDVGNGWLSFELQGPEERGNATVYHATYRAEGKVARHIDEQSIKRNGQRNGYGTACRQSDGSWRIVSANPSARWC